MRYHEESFCLGGSAVAVVNIVCAGSGTQNTKSRARFGLQWDYSFLLSSLQSRRHNGQGVGNADALSGQYLCGFLGRFRNRAGFHFGKLQSGERKELPAGADVFHQRNNKTSRGDYRDLSIGATQSDLDHKPQILLLTKNLTKER